MRKCSLVDLHGNNLVCISSISDDLQEKNITKMYHPDNGTPSKLDEFGRAVLYIRGPGRYLNNVVE